MMDSAENKAQPEFDLLIMRLQSQVNCCLQLLTYSLCLDVGRQSWQIKSLNAAHLIHPLVCLFFGSWHNHERISLYYSTILYKSYNMKGKGISAISQIAWMDFIFAIDAIIISAREQLWMVHSSICSLFWVWIVFFFLLLLSCYTVINAHNGADASFSCVDWYWWDSSVWYQRLHTSSVLPGRAALCFLSCWVPGSSKHWAIEWKWRGGRWR